VISNLQSHSYLLVRAVVVVVVILHFALHVFEVVVLGLRFARWFLPVEEFLLKLGCELLLLLPEQLLVSQTPAVIVFNDIVRTTVLAIFFIFAVRVFVVPHHHHFALQFLFLIRVQVVHA
jgi:hypothetical protein